MFRVFDRRSNNRNSCTRNRARAGLAQSLFASFIHSFIHAHYFYFEELRRAPNSIDSFIPGPEFDGVHSPTLLMDWNIILIP